MKINLEDYYDEEIYFFRHARILTEYDTTSNRRVYNLVQKMYREHTGEISCSRCPYHRSENFKNKGYDNRSWKNYRDKQYKIIGVLEC